METVLLAFSTQEITDIVRPFYVPSTSEKQVLTLLVAAVKKLPQDVRNKIIASAERKSAMVIDNDIPSDAVFKARLNSLTVVQLKDICHKYARAPHDVYRKKDALISFMLQLPSSSRKSMWRLTSSPNAYTLQCPT
ncbi:hypothetical protein BDN72DRAFT_906965 [Pluteus cervinus]|uniref:Uncharacterized protein n=1 Tax=Pluteus cervinus TaxID=181527 RepID=A0ACD2ZZZ7_9AGAR|nr:hypothetical protein BDN72DRAFT_906965 [Pluteus cervinus]